MHRIILLGTLMAFAINAPAQLSKWLLRNGSGEVRVLDLTGPLPILGSLIPSFGLGGSEDVNLMTDAAGNIRFSTAVGMDNKVQVRTASFSIMPNGNGLIGNSSSQASAIAPRPCHPQQYYIIHHNTETHELYWSLVDMTLNGGLGDVAEKNHFIASGVGEGFAVSHQLPNGCRWLFCFSKNESQYQIKRALVTASGIGEPVLIATVAGADDADWHTCLKLSPANDKLAISLPNYDSPGAGDVVIWPLDLESGTLGPASIKALSTDPIVGIEFSPAGGYLYFVGNDALSDVDFGRLDLASSQVQIIDPSIGSWILSIEAAGNGRIYVGTSGFPRTLAEVRFPDAPDINDIAYDHNAVIFLSFGFIPVLPNAIEGEPPGTTSTPDFIAFEITEPVGCEGHRFTSGSCLGTWQQWDFGDGWTDLRDQVVHHYGVGTFDVTLTTESCGELLSLTRPGAVTVEGVQPVAGMVHPDTVCQHASTSFENTSQLASAYNWFFGNGTSSTSATPDPAYHSPGAYTITLVAREGCINDTTRNNIIVLPAAIASFHTNSDPCDEVTRLINTSVDGVSWHWDLGDGDSTDFRDPIHTYTTMDAFTVRLTSDPGTMCADTAERVLYAGYGIIPVAWFVPNAFTPNGDGTNDELRIKGPEVCASPVMTIFNKWGQKMWEGDAKSGWDGNTSGQTAPEGVYVYTLHGKMSMSHGYVVLLR